MARKDSWFKWGINRWFAGTRRLSYEAKGFYADLITAWRDGQVVPNDAHKIADQFGVRDYRSVRRPLAELLQKGKVQVDAAGNLYRDDVDDEIAERLEQRRARKPDDDQGCGSGSGGPPAQPRLPLGPRLVHDSGDKSGETMGRGRETADSPETDRGLSADCSPSPARKPLIGNETGRAIKSPEWTESQTVVAATPAIPARARGSPSP